MSHAHLAWHKSSYCSTGTCVEVATDGANVHMRDSGNGAGPRLTFTREAWEEFVERVKNGDFDGPDR